MADNRRKEYGANYEFRGQVQIEDVKGQFDKLVTDINNMIDVYNAAGYADDIDLNDVSDELSPMDYTLSVGGLRKILDAYDGAVIGCKVYPVNEAKNLLITSGLLLTRNGGYKLPTAVLANDKSNSLWFSPSKGLYKGSSATIQETVDFTMPTITSNESWGKMALKTTTYGEHKTYNWNNIYGDKYSKAWFATKTNDGMIVSGALSSAMKCDLNWTWDNFPSQIKAKTLSFVINKKGGQVGGALTVNVTTPKGVVQVLQRGVGGARSDISIDVSKHTITGMHIRIDYGRTSAIITQISDLKIEGQVVTEVPAGGGASDANDWVRVAYLNQNRTEGALNCRAFDLGINTVRINARMKSNSLTEVATVDVNKDKFVACAEDAITSDLITYTSLFEPKGLSKTWGKYPKIGSVSKVNVP